MDARVPERVALRTEEGTKVPESNKLHPLNQLVRMRSPVQIWVAAPEALKIKVFEGFLLRILIFWCGLNVGQIVDPHCDPCGKRAGKSQRVPGRKFALPARFFSLSYMTCSMKLPIVAAASSCFCRLAWV